MAARKKAAAKTKRKSVKKAPARKAAKKSTKRAVGRATAKRTSAKSSMGHVSVGRKAFTKSQIISTVCDHTNLARKDVSAVFDCVHNIVCAHVQKSGPETFSWPGLFKIVIVKKPATKARQGINPFTGESMLFKAKPARRVVKVRALKQLKEMAS